MSSRRDVFVVLHVGRRLELDSAALLRYLRLLRAERDLRLPAGTLVDEGTPTPIEDVA